MDAVIALLTAAGSAGTAPGHASLDADMTEGSHGSLEGRRCDGGGMEIGEELRDPLKYCCLFVSLSSKLWRTEAFSWTGNDYCMLN
jgi:hypothetical protein